MNANTANTSTSTSTSTANTDGAMRAAKPAQLWAALAQCAPRAFKAAFVENAEALASAYTGPKQLENALRRVQAEYGLKPVFNRMLRGCTQPGATVECVFMEAVASMLDAPKAPAKTAPSKLEGILKALPGLSLEERSALMGALLALNGQEVPEVALV